MRKQENMVKVIETTEEFQPGSYLDIPKGKQSVTVKIHPMPLSERLIKRLQKIGWHIGIVTSTGLIILGCDILFYLFCFGIQCLDVESTNSKAASDAVLEPTPSALPLNHPYLMIFIIAVNLIVIGNLIREELKK